MANFTQNYNLRKPLSSENYNVDDQNGNMDLIDAALNGKLPSANIIKGSNTFNSDTGRTITHDIGNTNYKVSITPTTNPTGHLGEIYVSKNNNNIVVYCSGTDTTTTFDYVIYK